MRELIKHLLLLPLFIVASLLLSAQPNAMLQNFLTVENGLSHNEVTSIVQDRDGFIWIGTRGGLNRYDGYEFEIFNQVPGDSNSLVNPSVEKLFVDSKGNIWIGSKSGGVSKYNPVTGIFTNIVTNYKQSNSILPDNRVLCFNEDTKGRIWMGTWANGAIVYDEASNTSQQFFPGATINSIVNTMDGRLWLGTSQGLEEVHVESDSLEHHSVGSIQELWHDKKRNTLWLVQGSNSGFRKFDLENKTFSRFFMPNEVSHLESGNPPYESILLDGNDKVWLGTWGIGLFRFDPATEEFSRYPIYPENRGTINKDYDAILDIFEDRNGNIWLGTNGGGVCMLTKKLNFNSVGYHPEPGKGLLNTRIMTVIEDKEENLWLGTIGSGLVWSPDRENFYPVEYPEGISKTSFFTIKNLLEDKDGKIWAGTGSQVYEVVFENGIPKMLVARTQYDNLSFQRMIVSFLDANNMLWLGSLQRGLLLLDKKDNYKLIKRLARNNSSTGTQKSNRISYLLQDSKGRVWAGTYNGLHVYNPKDTSLVIAEDHYQIEGSFSGNIITCLDEDQQGNIWVGTPNGLNKLSENDVNKFSVSIYSEKDGLASNFVKGISHDAKGNIWLSTNIGISKLITSENNRVINFDETDGVLGRNFTEASVFRNQRSSEIFFGGAEGLTYFSPDDIIERKSVSKPVYTELSILNQQIKPGQLFDGKSILQKSITHTNEIKLSYLQDKIQVQFSALDFESTGKNQYKYRLNNLDKEWNDIGERRFIVFNDLTPGEYELLVKSSNRHNVWNEEPASLRIIIKPPFWQTWYALVFYVFVVIGIVTIIRWNAVKQVRLANSLEMEKVQHEQDQRLNEMKLRFFTNLSHEFRTPLTLILAPLKELLGKKDEFQLSGDAEHKIAIAQNNSQRLMKLVNQLLDFRKVESGNMKLFARSTNLEDFVAEVCHPFFELARINNIVFKLTVSLQTKYIWVDRDKLEVIINNLVSNAFKYIQENGKIEVSLFEEEEEVLLNVSDNGPGIPKTEINNIFERFYRVGHSKGYGSSGIGLALVKRYAELHKGSISVVSESNKHTEFTIALKKGTTHLQADEMVEVETKEPDFVRKEQFFNTMMPAKGKLSPKSEECILVVEDNPEVRNYLLSVLEPLYTVIAAENGVLGFELAGQKLPNLILSDVMMPEMDGFEFCKKIRETETTATIPFIFLTAKSDEQFRLLGTQLGADDFLSKPFDPNLLLEKVKNILSRDKKLQKQYSKSLRLGPSEIEITSGDEIFIEKLIATIEANLQNDKFTSDVLAGEMNMSNSSLYRKLKALTGNSTAEFIRSIRIKRAGQLLADRDRTVTEIAYQVGFNDVKHFRTVFQKQFGCTPSEYREKL
ncbi:response regulator [Prolixibacteraceae bacterium Z1-6]|uniref:histidine kinase n=1 Tax=Draconibacterium aestuarii TaxID=2998507 RepID=A0A9X3J5T4_9BACT|nr:response regulator [Prolixibacteraceae bacterium Z1-6]